MEESDVETKSFKEQHAMKWKLQPNSIIIIEILVSQMEATFFEEFRKTSDGKIYAICKFCGPVQYSSANSESYSN